MSNKFTCKYKTMAKKEIKGKMRENLEMIQVCNNIK